VGRAREDVEPRGVGCLAVYNAAALGLCALSCGDLTTAIDHLGRAWDAGQSAGLGNPNIVPFLDTLSPQELQVARAIGRGLNNVEAAAALFVSRKTVEAHLTRAYRKLGVRSRTELTPAC
jgi:DNA-binding NarL/FixJ family response regulator